MAPIMDTTNIVVHTNLTEQEMSWAALNKDRQATESTAADELETGYSRQQSTSSDTSAIEEILSPCMKRCSDFNIAIRQAGLQELIHLAKNSPFDTEFVLSEVCARIHLAHEDHDSALCESLLKAVPQIANRGDFEAVATLVSLAEDMNCWVRLQCVIGLGKLADTDDKVALSVLAARAAHPAEESWQVREAAVQAMQCVTGPANNDLLARVSRALLADPSPRVRQVASASCEGRGASAQKGAAVCPAKRPRARANHKRQQVCAVLGGAAATLSVALLVQAFAGRR